MFFEWLRVFETRSPKPEPVVDAIDRGHIFDRGFGLGIRSGISGHESCGETVPASAINHDQHNHCLSVAGIDDGVGNVSAVTGGIPGIQ